MGVAITIAIPLLGVVLYAGSAIRLWVEDYERI